MKKAFRKSLKRQASLGYFTNNNKFQSKSESRSSSSCTGTPVLWRALAHKYQFNYPRDWYRIESHWLDQIESFQEQPIDCPGRDGKMNNAITRISQCNESYQLCNSLPRSFIVPKDLKDFTLMNTMSTIIKDHRVPIISYCCPIEYRRNFIIRCASSDQQERVIDTLNKVVKPLKVLDLTSSASSLESVESAHKKLRDVCRPGGDGEHGLNFLSKSGKWLNIVSLALKLVNETAKILLTEASVILFEDEDRGWNSVISSLVQVMLEPHRRTIKGLESLISKEWIYLSGGQIDYSKPDTFFTLFLDCIYQIYLQNVTEFEFTSEYLRYLFESQYMPAPATSSLHNHNNHANNNNIHNQRTNGIISKSKTPYLTDEEMDIIGDEPASYKPSSISMVDLNFSVDNTSGNINISGEQLESGYSSFMLNPFYRPDKDSPTVGVLDHIINMKLWTSLYLRWQPIINYGCIEEKFYFQLCNPQEDTIILNSS